MVKCCNDDASREQNSFNDFDALIVAIVDTKEKDATSAKGSQHTHSTIGNIAAQMPMQLQSITQLQITDVQSHPTPSEMPDDLKKDGVSNGEVLVLVTGSSVDQQVLSDTMASFGCLGKS